VSITLSHNFPTGTPTGTGFLYQSAGGLAAGSGIQLVAWMDTLMGTDNTIPIQQAIDFALQNNISEVVLSTGKYMTTDTLMLGWGEGFHEVSLRGSKRAPYFSNYDVAIFPLQTDRPCIAIEGGRCCGVFGIGIRGRNYIYAAYAMGGLANLSSNVNNWLAPNLTPTGTNSGGLAVTAPYCGIAIDPYLVTDPTHPAKPTIAYPDRTPPAWTGLSGTNLYTTASSSDTTIDECSIDGFAVQIMSQPNGDSNGDFLRVRNSLGGFGCYGIAIVNTQSRNVELRNLSAFVTLHSFLTNMHFGGRTGIGQLVGPISNVACGQMYQLFDTNNNYSGPLFIDNCYTEQSVRIGNFRASGAEYHSVFFNGGQYDLGDTYTGQIPGSVITSDVPLTLQGINITGGRRIGCLNNGSGQATINNSHWRGYTNTSPTTAVQIRAINYCGGMLIGSSRFNVASTNEMRSNQVNGSYFTVRAVTGGTYDSPSGNVTLTLVASAGVNVGDNFFISNAMGTGADIASVNGTFTALAGSGGTTLIYNIGTGKTITAINSAVFSSPKLGSAQISGDIIYPNLGTNRTHMTQHAKIYRDDKGRLWNMAVPPDQIINTATEALTHPACAPVYSADTVTFDYNVGGNEPNSRLNIFTAGDIIYHTASGTVYVVETVGASFSASGGTYRTITLKQQNNLSLAINGTWVANLGAPAGPFNNTTWADGQIVHIVTNVVIPWKLQWGTFSTTNINITNISGGDTSGLDLKGYCVIGDVFYGQQTYSIRPGETTPTQSYWVNTGTGNSIVNILAAGPPGGAITLQFNPEISGTYPIFPYELR
jgi:hypothetical protein